MITFFYTSRQFGPDVITQIPLVSSKQLDWKTLIDRKISLLLTQLMEMIRYGMRELVNQHGTSLAL